MKISVFSGVLAVIWFLAYIYLCQFYEEVTVLCALVVLGVASAIFAIDYAKKFFNLQSSLTELSFLQNVTYAVGQYFDLVVFDQFGKTLWTSHPNAYPNKEAFLKKMFQRFPNDIEKIRESTQKRTQTNLLLHSQQDAGKMGEKWFIYRSRVLEDWEGQFALVISVHDVTPQVDPLYQFKKRTKKLENFIDLAPFGLLYVNSSGHIVGINKTLCGWVGGERNNIVGQPLKTLIPSNLDEYNGSTYTQVKTFQGESIDLLLTWDHTNVSKTRSIFIVQVPKSLETNPQSKIQDLSFSKAAIPAILINPEGQILVANQAFIQLIKERALQENGISFDSLSQLLHPAVSSEKTSKLRRFMENPNESLPPLELRFKDDKLITTAYLSRLPGEDKNHHNLLLQLIDISEQKRLEKQFAQSQKMQAVGQLAGGIAHDFNNLLTAMIGFCDLLLQRYLPNDPSYTDVMQIKQNATRAANLVRQLLAFSRQQNLQPKVVIITDILDELSALLRRLIGADIELDMTYDRDIWPIKVDVSQLEQVIINLVVNARDAMSHNKEKDESILRIKTQNYQCQSNLRLGHEVLVKGDYIMVEVTDTGHGIPADHIEHIFEPFFSTKEIGQGTGLGLSTVYGIIKQTGGLVYAENHPKRGAIFRIYLPRHYGEELVEVKKHEISQDLTGSGTILLVEDEDAVRMFSARALREKGYRVIEASGGEEAYEMVKKGERFDIMITDVVMPKMDGPTLSKKIRDLMPDIKVIFISGYTEDTFRKNLDHDAKIHFLPKPFTLKDLALKVKEVLTMNKQEREGK